MLCRTPKTFQNSPPPVSFSHRHCWDPHDCCSISFHSLCTAHSGRSWYAQSNSFAFWWLGQCSSKYVIAVSGLARKLSVSFLCISCEKHHQVLSWSYQRSHTRRLVPALRYIAQGCFWVWVSVPLFPFLVWSQPGPGTASHLHSFWFCR